MKKISILFLFVSILIVSSCTPDKYPDLQDGIYAEITTDKGVIVAHLEFEKVPSTVSNFITLTEGTNTHVDEKFKNKKFYDGMSFQKNDYVIQTGDPKGEGSGTGYFFEDEFPVDNEGNFLLTHDAPGVLAMANSGRDTNSSQFFINLNKAPSLDGKHSVFGKVILGMDVVNRIESEDIIQKIVIIRKGTKAKEFDALAQFEKHFKAFTEKKNKEIEKAIKRNKKAEKAKKQMRNFFINNKRLAKEYASGLSMLVTKKGNGIKPKLGSQVLINYAGFTEDGNLFSTSILETAEIFNMYDERYDHTNKYHPLTQLYSKKSGLIKGFTEGLLKMKYGEKALLFIPAKLAYGEKGDGYSIAPNSNIVIEVEILDKVLE